MKKVIITGPTGAIGHALIEKCLDEGCEVFAICRPNSERIKSLPQHVRLHILEYDLSELKKANESLPVDCDVLYHFGWAATFGDARNDMPTQIKNIQYTIDAVHLAHVCGCSTFIGAGSQAEYGRVEGKLSADTPAFPENGYGMAKLCAGEMSRVEAQKLGIKHIWTRILSVYGPYDGQQTLISSAIRSMLSGEKLSMTAGEQLWDYLYSSDAADALYAMAENGKDGSVYVLGSGKALPLREYVEIIRDIINPDLEIGFGERPYFKDQVMHLEADISDLTKDTGWIPKINFYNGVSMLIQQKHMFKQRGLTLYKIKKKFNICLCLCKKEVLVGGEYCA